ncbi:MAG: Flp pilus assembly protein CpaB, partial [Gemmataceae bacterium]|nr:Flp pilus assembly protein CpaB [Gemmataceae bacterium]
MKQKNLVLMVVAVGCGLAAAFLTAQMSAKPAAVETVDLLVAAKDLPIGTVLTKEKLDTLTKKKAVSRDAVPAKAIDSLDELADKRLTRTIRADEGFTPADLLKGFIQIPPGKSMVTLPVTATQAAAGFLGNGSRVDVLASVKLNNRVRAFPILVNMLVLAVNNDVLPPKDGAYQTVSMVSFAVEQKQALLIKLAQARSCDLSLLLRNPEDKETENDRSYDIEQVVALLADEKTKTDVRGEDRDRSPEPEPQPAPAPPPAPKPETVSVPVAAADLPAGTVVTADLLADPTAFAAKELPKEIAADAVTDFGPYLGQTLKTGLGKGQWATAGLIGPAETKPGAKDEFVPPKEEPKPEPPVVKEAPKPTPKPPARRTHDVSVHTPSGTHVFRYEEVRPGEWRLRGRVPAAADPAP